MVPEPNPHETTETARHRRRNRRVPCAFALLLVPILFGPGGAAVLCVTEDGTGTDPLVCSAAFDSIQARPQRPHQTP